MRVNYAFLAQAAEIAADGKMYVLGGDIDTVRSPEFPATHPSLSVVVKLVGTPEEHNEAHELVVRLVAPDEAEVSRAGLQIPAGPKGLDLRDGQDVKFGLVAQFVQVLFREPGEYRIKVSIDGEEVVCMPLRLIRA